VSGQRALQFSQVFTTHWPKLINLSPFPVSGAVVS